MSSQRITALIHHLDSHGPTSLGRAAQLLGTSWEELRAEILAFTDVETSGLILDSLFTLEPAGGWPEEGPDPEPAQTDVVSFACGMGIAEAGIRHQDAAVLGPLLAAATQLRAMEPDNLELAAAADKLAATLMRNTVAQATYRSAVAADIQRAAREHRQIQMTYSNAWLPRVRERIVHPYRVVSTARGYELDAGPLDDNGRPRTYLLPRIRDYRVLHEHFAVPANLDEALAANRRLTPVSGYSPHSGLWAIRRFSEITELQESDSEGATFTAWLLPPVPDRAGLMLLLAGRDAYLDDPALDAQRDIRATELAEHHGLSGT